MTYMYELINRMDMLCRSMFRTQWIKIELSFSLMQSLLNTRNRVSVAAGILYYYGLCIQTRRTCKHKQTFQGCEG